jgi:exonuclease SbcC
MIPRRVCVRGFLCYRDEQEIGFDGAALWMLAGLNGSGKSSIFDAVTYALFGHHRGGHQHAAELINKDSDGLLVEFDFSLDGERYRAKRTLKKNPRGSTSATQQILHYRAGENAKPGRWEPLPDTSRKIEFDAWVHDNVGLTYETFTSSVLLLQGRAEKLLDSTPKGRFEVLAGIVELDRYARLHARADDQRKTLKAKSEALGHQLAALPEVEPAEVAALEERIATAEAEREQVRAEVERLQGVEFRARQWADLQTRRTALEQRWRQAQGLLAEADAIERDLTRLRELREILPHLRVVVTQRGQVQESERKITELTQAGEALAEQLAACDHALEQARQKRGRLQKTLAADEQKQRDVAERLRKLTAVLEQVKQIEGQERDLSRLKAELARLPADAAEAVTRAQGEVDRLTALGQTVLLLSRLHREREELRQARERVKQAQVVEADIRSQGERLGAEIARLTPQLEGLTRTRQEADEQATAARALLQQARDLAEAFGQLEGAKVCRACGQPLTPGHHAAERAKREAEVKAAAARAKDATTAQQSARQAEEAVSGPLAKLEKQRQDKREEYREAKQRAAQATQEVERLGRACDAAYDDLPARERAKVASVRPADWLTTSYPTSADLDGLRREAASVESARAKFREAQEQSVRWATLRAQIDAMRRTVTALKSQLLGEPDVLRQEFTRMGAEEQALAGALKAQRAEARTVQEEMDRLNLDREKIQRQQSDCAGRQKAEESTLKHSRQAYEAAYKPLPPAWRPHADRGKLADLNGWELELDQLRQKGTEAKATSLQQARSALEPLRQGRADLEREAEAFPEETRRPVADVQKELSTARQRGSECEAAFQKLQQQKAMLEGRRQQREQLHQQVLEVEREHNYHSLLAQLLGPNRLQLYLVRQAERQIVDHANAVLDRLSGGQLYLQLRGGEEAGVKALELEAYNRTTGRGAINVAFLSGSQRFRVAVSLALGIGQYASRQHRPIESVIIDEGFGCLDRHGRQVMIQELQNLRGHLHCILLVSHQEEFAEAFNDGYRFELQDGTTKAVRIQR